VSAGTFRREATGVMMGHYPYQFCGLCGSRIHWVFVRKVGVLTGKKMPCEIDLKRGDGRMTLVTNDGHVRVKAGPEVLGYEPHFGHCGEYKKLLQETKTQGRAEG